MVNEILLEMKDIHMLFPGVKALDGVSLTLHRGEVLTLLGENGAGKSTLMKILSGAHQKTQGEIYFKGKRVEITRPDIAQLMGISIIYQEFNLIPQLSVAENIFLGRQPRKKGAIDWKEMNRRTALLLDEIGLSVSPKELVCNLKVAQQQMVELAKAISFNCEVVIMDEPTSALSDKESAQLFKTIKKLTAKQIGVIYISHRLDEIHEVGDTAMIMRDGALIERISLEHVDIEYLICQMVGRSIQQQYPKEEIPTGDEILRVEHISVSGKVDDCSFRVHRGEILGFSGLVGAGRTELMQAITGAVKRDDGEVYMDGAPVKIQTFQDAVKHGIGYLTEDRKQQGLVLMMDVKSNITLVNLQKLIRRGRIDLKKERETAQQLAKSLHIKSTGLGQKVMHLSGGNQQKVVLAKWLFSNCKVFIFDEPTRGIDVGAKVEIYKLMEDLAKQGAGVIMVSSELPEIIGISDRVIVMHAGKIAGELARCEATQVEIMRLATGRCE